MDIDNPTEKLAILEGILREFKFSNEQIAVLEEWRAQLNRRITFDQEMIAEEQERRKQLLDFIRVCGGKVYVRYHDNWDIPDSYTVSKEPPEGVGRPEEPWNYFDEDEYPDIDALAGDGLIEIDYEDEWKYTITLKQS